ncbi:Gfo/Idh/MocA family protein [Corynebacterium stationis]|uniref:Gfo/Idh/MocA family oxidoreductase n=1 Tax=Corynebacterium stationis TaxID=1705 RepID=A0AB36CI99_9CORY|nr:Gfo/Idh/MocA family oxidoreductase [Corynebacterium stationis]NME88543.1 Gfo/Idh/MocA family oxidoreductase [Corynebacterium stationis]
MSTERRTLNIGVISLGWMGRLHARSYLAVAQYFTELPVRVVLHTAADPDEGGRNYAYEALGFKNAVSDYKELLANPEIDAVSICSPNFLHHEIAMAAIEAGKPFWIEKPMGRSAAESQEIATGATDAGLVTSVGFNYRHVPAIAEARRLVRAGEIGTINNVRVSFKADYSADPLGALTWRFKKELAGSGVLGDLMSHGFDLAQFIVGKMDAVTATNGIFIQQRPLPASGAASHFSQGVDSAPKGEVENEDYTAVLGRFESGAIGVFESSRVAVGPRAEYIIEVYGSKGSLRWNFHRLNELELADSHDGYRTIMASPSYGEFSRFQPGAGTSMGFDDLKTIEAYLYLRSILEDKQYAPSVGDGWAAAEIADAALESAESGQWVDIKSVDAPTTFDREF